jgi:hypothetical protein
MITKRVGRINEGIRGPKHLLDTDTSIQLFFYHFIHCADYWPDGFSNILYADTRHPRLKFIPDTATFRPTDWIPMDEAALAVEELLSSPPRSNLEVFKIVILYQYRGTC